MSRTAITGEPPDPALRYRGWVHLGTTKRVRRRGSVTVRRFGRDITVSPDATGGFVAVDADRSERVAVTEVGGVVLMYQRAPGDPVEEPPPPRPLAGEVLATRGAFRSSFHFQIHSSLPTLVENAIDRAHFPAVHGRHVDAAGPIEIDVRDDGTFWAKADLGATIPPGIPRRGSMEVEFSDPFTSLVRTQVLSRDYDLLVLTAPMGDLEVDILFTAISPRFLPVLDLGLHLGMTVNQGIVVRDDRAVLATRTITPRPILSDVDGPIMAIRQWLRSYCVPDPADEVVPC